MFSTQFHYELEKRSENPDLQHDNIWGYRQNKKDHHQNVIIGSLS